ncbi:MAG: B12-binding domain-containing radical SAM protein, partial [Firmicutes bacterium]|nr:B12-binding domain-containing radical SAM protein [Bacillota bacterium]
MIRQRQMDRLLKRVEKPGRYIGREINSIMKDPEKTDLRFGFAFPDTYEIGMSFVGMQILYTILNHQEGIFCERIFAPADDMEKIMREEDIPLFTIETKTPVREMDIIGFTLQYELSYTNILNMLELSGIPLTRKEREESGQEWPLITAGGPCAFNPEPLADIFDLFMIGDGEENIVEISELYIKCRDEGADRRTFLEKASKLQGIYIPEFYEPEYNEDGTIAAITRTGEGAPEKVERALIDDLDKAP